MKHSRIIKIKDKKFTYNIDGTFKNAELTKLDEFLGSAYLMAKEVQRRLLNFDENTKEFFELIYAESEKESVDIVKNANEKIIKRIEKELNIVREKLFVDDAGSEQADVMSAAKREKRDVIYIYNSFFENLENDKGINDRSSIILHEVGHLVGFLEEDDTDSLNSAECLRNFTLLICEIVNKEVFIEKNEGKKSEEKESENSEEENILVGEDGELPFNPNRHPAGSSQGGQFAPKDGGASDDVPIDKPKEKNPKTKSKDEESYDDKDKSDEDEKKVKANLELINNGIEYDKNWPNSSNWAAANLKIEGQEPNTPKTVVVEYEYTYENIEGNSVMEDAKIAFDAMTDEDGNIDISRVGILGEYNTEKSHDKWQDTDLNIKLKVSTIDGSVKDNYGEPKEAYTPDVNDSTYRSEIEEIRRDYGLAYYPVWHASLGKNEWFKTKRPANATGGGVSGRKDPSNIKLASEFEIQYDSKTGKTNLLKGSMTTGGKGYDNH